jgi:hypothetical protein
MITSRGARPERIAMEPRARLLLRISATLKAGLATLAERESRSVNKQISFF